MYGCILLLYVCCMYVTEGRARDASRILLLRVCRRSAQRTKLHNLRRLYSHIGALRNCNVKKTRRELSRWDLRNRATRADTLSKRAVHVQPPQLSTACLRRPQHELREQRQHCTSSSTLVRQEATPLAASNALRRIGHRGRPCSWRGGGGDKALFLADN